MVAVYYAMSFMMGLCALSASLKHETLEAVVALVGAAVYVLCAEVAALRDVKSPGGPGCHGKEGK